jgi:hypothetical protein
VNLSCAACAFARLVAPTTRNCHGHVDTPPLVSCALPCKERAVYLAASVDQERGARRPEAQHQRVEALRASPARQSHPITR